VSFTSFPRSKLRFPSGTSNEFFPAAQYTESIRRGKRNGVKLVGECIFGRADLVLPAKKFEATTQADLGNQAYQGIYRLIFASGRTCTQYFVLLSSNNDKETPLRVQTAIMIALSESKIYGLQIPQPQVVSDSLSAAFCALSNLKPIPTNLDQMEILSNTSKIIVVERCSSFIIEKTRIVKKIKHWHGLLVSRTSWTRT
jgi:hypothetical protein